MNKKPKIGDKVSYPISNNGTGIGVVIDPELNGIPKNDRLYYAREKYVLVQAIINNKASYSFWQRYKNLTLVPDEPKDSVS